ncbi:hypothetical protein [Kaarinaea lacus]
MTNAAPLPYDMGNAGDLIKHGLIAEFCEWWLETHNSVFTFIDPFGGRTCVSPPNIEVSRRIQQLVPCALKRAQQDYKHCYYGSSNVIKQTVQGMNRQALIKISDRDEKAVQDLLDAGFELFNHKAFQRNDSFSILDCSLSPGTASLLLLDPFDDFLPEFASVLVPGLPDFILNNGVPVALFVLCEDWNSGLGSKWQSLKDEYLAHELIYLSLACNKIPSSPVKGEARYHSEVLLLLPANDGQGRIHYLVNRLQTFAELLGAVLGQTVRFKCNWVD